MDQEELKTISNLINLTKNTKITHYMPVLRGKMNCRLGKAKFNSLMIVLKFGAIYSIYLGKHMQKLRKKMTKSVRWSTQGGDLHTNSKSKVENLLHELDVTKSIIWNFHVDDSPRNHKCDMILGRGIFSKLKTDLCLSDNTIRGNGGA